ncbi:16S rRNA (cytidine1402-2'-O)-methyltransferase [Spiroplasma helicoides]|uniref:16S rRNA (Cytidine1402-2'-O)-methyltransferase n=1 Tax=Spiroplasma helicoides TaxID=216938 RepID=A0A1B3SJS9_9MOLU|nr:16S rRNA (cytidine(1402)-2'-O)-methyltransferase [Spiroplasma helicoides]AOG60178.1 16S rRNA (cytidine1402-2'-O)-methyltransferase [Spiroplasma helicoides]
MNRVREKQMIKIQKTFKNDSPIIYVVGTPIGNLSDFSYRAIDTLNNVDEIYCEDTRTSQALLKQYNIKNNLISLHKYNEISKVDEVANKLMSRNKIALISDAGVPCISDPGAKFLSLLSEKEINFSVCPVNCGPAYVHAIIMSRFFSQKHIFLGFLEKKVEKIKEDIKSTISNNKETIVVFYESVHRIKSTISILKTILDSNAKIAVAREITKVNEEIVIGNIVEVNDFISSDEFILKGEFVVVIDNKACLNEVKVNIESAMIKINELIKKGVSKKEAIKTIATALGINKNELYDFFHKK